LREPSYKPAVASAPIGDWTKAVAEFAQRLRAEVLATAAMTEGLSQRRNERNEKAIRVCARTGRFLLHKRPRSSRFRSHECVALVAPLRETFRGAMQCSSWLCCSALRAHNHFGSFNFF